MHSNGYGTAQDLKGIVIEKLKIGREREREGGQSIFLFINWEECLPLITSCWLAYVQRPRVCVCVWCVWPLQFYNLERTFNTTEPDNWQRIKLMPFCVRSNGKIEIMHLWDCTINNMHQPHTGAYCALHWWRLKNDNQKKTHKLKSFKSQDLSLKCIVLEVTSGCQKHETLFFPKFDHSRFTYI